MNSINMNENQKFNTSFMKKKKYNVERDCHEEMFKQKFYNEKPIKGYNHLTGTLDSKIRPDLQVERVWPVGLNTCLLVNVINVLE